MQRRKYVAKDSNVQLTSKEVFEISLLFKSFDKDDDYELSYDEVKDLIYKIEKGKYAK
jgi:Ca2+-binding EF-hand superfamily protein